MFDDESPGGWVKLWRKMLRSPIWNTSNFAITKLALYCLMRAGFEMRTISVGGNRVDLEPGSFWSSLPSLSVDTGLSTQNIRTAMNNLKNLEFLTYESTANGRKITVLNWDTYQSGEDQPNRQINRQLTDDQQTGNRRVTGNKNIKNVKKEEDPTRSARGELKQNIWGWWVDANRAAGRADPLRLGADTGQVKQIQKMQIADDRVKLIMQRYLNDEDRFLVSRGYPLRDLVARINRYNFEPREDPFEAEALRIEAEIKAEAEARNAKREE